MCSLLANPDGAGSQEPRATRSGFRSALRYGGFALALAIVAYLVRRIWLDWGSLQTYTWTLHVEYLAGSLACILAAYAIMARSWRSVLRAIGVRWPYARAFWVFYLSNLGRYIPGHLWQISAAALMGRQLGVSAGDTATSMIVHLLYFLPVGTAMALLTGSFPAPFDSPAIQWIAWGASALCLAVALFPHVLLQGSGRWASRLGLDPERWRVSSIRRLGILAQTLVAWIFLSLGFSLLVLAVMPVPTTVWWDLARVYIVAHLLGFVTLIAPAGLGVREGVMVFLLSPLVGTAPAAGVALLARLWYTLSELLMVGVAGLCFRSDRKALAESSPEAK